MAMKHGTQHATGPTPGKRCQFQEILGTGGVFVFVRRKTMTGGRR